MMLLVHFIRDESGATAIEYSLIAAMIALVIIAGARTTGTKLNATFTKITGNL